MSFKLDRLAPVNGFTHENAHDALADVLATVHLARLIRERAPVVWDAAMANRTKAAATAFVEEEPVFVATNLRFGRHLSRVVTALGVNPANSGELFTLGLDQDPALVATMDEEELGKHLFARPRPVSALKLNASPIFMPIDIAGPHATGYELGHDELLRRAMQVRSDPGLRERLVARVLAAREPYRESQHVEEQIYGSFYSRSDEALIDDFHRVDWRRRLELSSQFDDARLRTLSRRLIYIEAPEVMPDNLRKAYRRGIAARIHSRSETTGRWTTLELAIEECQKLLTDIDDDSAKLLRGHLAQLTVWRGEASQLLNGG